MIKAWRPRLPSALKLPPSWSEFTQRHMPRCTPGFWIWSGATAVLVFICVLLLAKVFFAGDGLTAEAINEGQRVTIRINNGDVEGNARITRHEEAGPATPSGPDAPATIISKEGLAPAPLVSISMQTDRGLVPVVGQDGTIPWKYYARPYASKEKRPLVAIVLTNLGLSKTLTEDVLKLPHTFTLSFSPYAGDARNWAKKAREEGFETLVDLPMQPTGYRTNRTSDPGPYGLLDDLGTNETSARLRWVLSRFPGFVGMLASQDEELTPNVAVMRPILIELAAHGVLFLYVKSPQNAALADLAKSRSLFALGIDKVVDDEIAMGPIEKKLEDLTTLAKSQGYAIGLAHSYPPTIEVLGRWADSLAAQGVDLVPVSAAALKELP